mmetsp:Transcript_12389/g.13706  ORF Transcript_12389/g.13706 Transcript_12389/m.13706 type:complete len:490 (+) Transcript_12389:70-1539(+)
MAKLILALLLIFLVAPVHTGQIKYVVSLMLENRSFDHYLGHLAKVNPEINGLHGNETCVIDPADPSKGSYKVSFDAPDVMAFDPSHGVEPVTIQVFGSMTPVSPAPMNGFVKDSPAPKKDIMRCLNMSMTASLSAIATEFALFDHWYASVPGPTQPNRMFYQTGTSYGATADLPVSMIEGYPQRTIFDDIYESDKTFNIYYGDVPASLELSRVRDYPLHILEYGDFLTAAKEGKLPNFSYIEPRYYTFFGANENDQHPPNSIIQGEFLIKQVYEAVRNSPQWNETLLLITYDEHGGLYDHVSTPLKDVPNPDGKIGKDGFTFERLGVRVPTVAVSPLIKKGTIVHEPAVNHYDHTSMIATVRKILDLKQPALTKREAWAATFEHLWEDNEPRTDCFTSVPLRENEEESYAKFEETERMPFVSSSLEQVAEGPKDLTPINGLQMEMAKIAWSLTGGDTDLTKLKTAHDGAVYVRSQMKRWFDSKTGEGPQ